MISLVAFALRENEMFVHHILEQVISKVLALQYNLFIYQNGLTDLTEIRNHDFLGDDASFE